MASYRDKVGVSSIYRFQDEKLTSSEMAHEQLLLLMITLEANFDDNKQLLIQGVRGKIDEAGKIVNLQTLESLQRFINDFENQF